MTTNAPINAPMTGSGLIQAFTRHPVAANLLMLLMLVAGFFGLPRINTQFLPSVEVPNISISIAWPGASPTDVADNILEAIEPEVRFLDDVKEVIAYAREGAATVSIEFNPNADMQKAQADVEQAIASITTFPDDSEEPSIRRRNFYEGIARLAISGPYSEQALKVIAKRIRDDLLGRGVDRVVINGVRDEEIWIEVEQEALRRLDLNLAEIADRISSSTRDLPSGTIEGDVERQVRALGEAETPESYANIEIRSLPSGEKILLRDIATVEARFDDDDPRGFLGGGPAIELAIQRAATADTLTSSRVVDEYLAELLPTLPPNLSVTLYDVRAARLQQRIDLLLRNGIGGLAIVLVVLFVFLNARIAIWVAAGIPVAMMMTLAVMWLTGQSINMVSLFALILTLGIIVDDAIVVGEHTATLHQRGMSALDAAETGAGRMLIPVTAATLTTQAAFLPLFLVRDVIGQIMVALPLVVVAVLAASLVESFLILPGHLYHALRRREYRPGRFRRTFDAGFGWVRDVPFRALASLAFNWRYATVALSIAILVIAFGLFSGGRVKFQFFPSPEPEIITGRVVFAAGIPSDQASKILQQIEAALFQGEEKLTGGESKIVTSTFSILGRSGNVQDDSVASISVQLSPSEERDIRTRQILSAWREAVPALPGVDRVVIAGRHGGTPGRDLDIRLMNAPSEVLKQAALEVRDLLTQYSGVTSIDDDLPFGKQELVLELTPRGKALGFTIQDVGVQVRGAFQGTIATRFARGDEEITVRVMYNQDDRSFEGFRDLYLQAGSGRRVPLSEVVSIRENVGFSIIQRRDGRNSVSVTAEVDNLIANNRELVEALNAGPVEEIAQRYNIEYEFAGREQERANAFVDLRLGLAIALGLIYLILAWVLGSYARPLAVMLIIPFGVIGAILGHYVMGFPLTILSFMGLLGLTGILVNDSIILVTRLDERLAEGEALGPAAIGASQDRLRAVLLTSLTTIGGLMPLLFERSLQAQFLLPMAITLVFGLAVATALVLFLVPAFVGIGADIGRFMRWILGRQKQIVAAE